MYDAFRERGVSVIAIAQEDTDLESHAKFLEGFEPEPHFEIVADLGRAKTAAFDHVTTYLIARDGTVQQVFPNLIRFRASWNAILGEIDRHAKPAKDEALLDGSG